MPIQIKTCFLLVAAVSVPFLINEYVKWINSEEESESLWSHILQINNVPDPHCHSDEIIECNMESCFDFSKCPLSLSFTFYLYPLKDTTGYRVGFENSAIRNNNSTVKNLHHILSQNEYNTKDPAEACVYIAVVEVCDENMPETKIVSQLEKLPHWSHTGRNHIVWVHCSAKVPALINGNKMSSFNSHQAMTEAMTIGSVFEENNFRRNFDMVAILNQQEHTNILGNNVQPWEYLPPLVPIRRKYLATFVGTPSLPFVQNVLSKMQKEESSLYLFDLSCNNSLKANESNFRNETSKNHSQILLNSTFSVIIFESEDFISNDVIQFKLLQALKHGSIPVIIGSQFSPPFREVLDWSKIMLRLPMSRLPELSYLLKSFATSDIFEFRKNGRVVFEKYLSSNQKVVDTVVAIMRTRIGLAPLPLKGTSSLELYNKTSKEKTSNNSKPDANRNKSEHFQPPFQSPSFSNNFSSVTLHKYEYWNSYYVPFKSMPFTTWKQPLPAHFLGENVSTIIPRPRGYKFSKALSGNYFEEQFTVVLLTYKRDIILAESLKRLKGTPFLNKILVVWNSPEMPILDLDSLDIGVKIQVIKMKNNSLNNRLLPFDAIETEAILSLDDDTVLRPEKIFAGFRIWRENRDRIVGFTNHYHFWHSHLNQWHFESKPACESSIILLGNFLGVIRYVQRYGVF